MKHGDQLLTRIRLLNEFGSHSYIVADKVRVSKYIHIYIQWLENLNGRHQYSISILTLSMGLGLIPTLSSLTNLSYHVKYA